MPILWGEEEQGVINLISGLVDRRRYTEVAH
jgi:hypothetical protein